MNSPLCKFQKRSKTLPYEQLAFIFRSSVLSFNPTEIMLNTACLPFSNYLLTLGHHCWKTVSHISLMRRASH